MNDHDNDIDALLTLLAKFGWERYHATAKALVAERNALREENNALASRCKVQQDEVLDRVFEMDAMRKRIAELEAASKPADRDESYTASAAKDLVKNLEDAASPREKEGGGA